MRTRVEDAWDLFRKVYKRTKEHDDRGRGSSSKFTSLKITGIETGMTRLSMESQPSVDLSRPELYVDAPTRMIWNSLILLLCAIAKHVTVRDERFEEILDMLDPVLARSDVREALECSNADTVWLTNPLGCFRNGTWAAKQNTRWQITLAVRSTLKQKEKIQGSGARISIKSLRWRCLG